ncbi:MAG: HEAT repeat domain-containing protein [Chloroflexota bacterium]
MSQITGREPRLSAGFVKKGERRLSLRRFATMLNMLPPEAVSLDALAVAVHNEEFLVRFNAASMLARRGDRDARTIVEETLKKGEAPARASVARHLYGFSWFSAEAMIRQALKDSDYRVREAAIYALCDLREYNAYQLMVEVLKNEDDRVREAATWGLRDNQDAAAVPVLAVCLEAQDPDVRIKALEALGQNDTPEAKPVVREAMNDPEPDVKYAAVLSLLELSGEEWLQELSGIIGRTSGVTLQQVLRGFFHATNYLKINVARSKAADLMIDALETALTDDMPEVRQAVIWPLAWMGHARTPGIIRRTWTLEQDSSVRAEIVRIATSLMAENAGASEEARQVADMILTDALASGDEAVQTVALGVKANREAAGMRVGD